MHDSSVSYRGEQPGGRSESDIGGALASFREYKNTTSVPFFLLLPFFIHTTTLLIPLSILDFNFNFSFNLTFNSNLIINFNLTFNSNFDYQLQLLRLQLRFKIQFKSHLHPNSILQSLPSNRKSPSHLLLTIAPFKHILTLLQTHNRPLSIPIPANLPSSHSSSLSNPTKTTFQKSKCLLPISPPFPSPSLSPPPPRPLKSLSLKRSAVSTPSSPSPTSIHQKANKESHTGGQAYGCVVM